jgi:hypothetical protein
MSIRSIITKGLGGLARWFIKSKFDLADDDGTPPVIPPQVPGNGIFKTPWSPLITNGLGTSACCGLLLAGMGSWQCFIGITPPPVDGGGGGGGGSYATNPSIYVPWPKKVKRKDKTRVVVITVMSSGKKWEHNYVIDEKNSKLAIQVINIINKTTAKIAVGVGRIDKARKSVIATFRNK